MYVYILKSGKQDEYFTLHIYRKTKNEIVYSDDLT